MFPNHPQTSKSKQKPNEKKNSTKKKIKTSDRKCQIIEQTNKNQYFKKLNKISNIFGDKFVT